MFTFQPPLTAIQFEGASEIHSKVKRLKFVCCNFIKANLRCMWLFFTRKWLAWRAEADLLAVKANLLVLAFTGMLGGNGKNVQKMSPSVHLKMGALGELGAIR